MNSGGRYNEHLPEVNAYAIRRFQVQKQGAVRARLRGLGNFHSGAGAAVASRASDHGTDATANRRLVLKWFDDDEYDDADHQKRRNFIEDTEKTGGMPVVIAGKNPCQENIIEMQER